MTRCAHHLGTLPCVNPHPHEGDGRGCVHVAAWLADEHDRSEA